MRIFRFVLALSLFLHGRTALAQETFPRNDVKDTRTDAFAFTNATIVVDDQTFLQNATLVIKSGKIEQVGTQVAVPAGYTTVDLKGKYIYPSLIDMYTSYGLSDVERTRGGNPYGGAEQIDSKTKGPYNANQAIRSHYNAADEFSINSKTADELRKAIEILTSQPVVGLDTETTDLDPLTSRLRLIQLATPDRVFIVDFYRRAAAQAGRGPGLRPLLPV